MSFNTRSGRGRGLQQTQVTYHQTPPRMQPTPSPYQSPYLQHQLPPFNPAPGPVSPAPAQPAPPGVVPQPLPVPTQDQQPQFKTMQITKMESGSPPGSPSQLAEKEPTETRPWKKTKNPSLKVNKVLKRRRLNARFRKILFPKNAIMVLNELQPGVQFEGSESTNAFSQTSYSVKIEIDGVKYTGEGSTKASAKAAAAELAVKGIILKKIAESAKKDAVPVEEEPMETASGDGDDVSEKGSLNGGRKVIPEDEVPWSSLASFALFKLFAEWKTQGSVIPPVVSLPSGKSANKNSNPRNKPPGPAAATAIAAGTAANATYVALPASAGGGVAASLVKAVPENAETLHPVTLVGRLFPGTAFTEVSRVGTPPHLTFTMGVNVNGIAYEGVGKNKKEAKKQCAMEVLRAAGVPFNPN
ncbi:double-stranded RNA-specific editase 1 [Thrips palmi]|uniref:Double-stranded RNA-specific editase 1 n=1 Tax=Thrips palmi TaxID=161013 RepID=A0A6P8ZGR6_THRPL|nr:double-stranded RNA-specific editase 1 [Thrips palmi]